MTSERSAAERRAAAIALLLERRQQASALEESEPIRVREWPHLLPLTPAQQRVLAADELAGSTPIFTLSLTIPIRRPADLVAAGLRECINRHAALRTQIVTDADGNDHQRVRPASEIPVTYRRIQGGRNSPELTELAEAERRHRFDVRSEALFRALIAVTDDAECHLIVTLHHLVADAVSLQLIIEEIENGHAMPAKGIDYPDLAVDAASDSLGDARLLRTTVERLQGAPRPLSPAPHAASLEAGASIHVPLDIDTELLARIRNAAGATGAGDSGIMLAALLTVLRRFSGTNDLVFGVPVHGRTQPGSETIVGLFVNTFIARIAVSETDSFLTVAKAARECLNETADGRAPSLPDALRAVYSGPGPRARLGVSFNRFDVPSRSGPLGGLDYPLSIGNDVPLVLQISSSSESYEATLIGDAAAYGPNLLGELAVSVTEVLRQGLACPEARVGKLGRPIDVLSAASQSHGAAVALHERVAMAGHGGDQLAAEHEDGATATYSELLARVGVARSAIADIPLGSVIALEVGRSIDLIAALVAAIDTHMILPLPADLPPERRAAMLRRISPAAYLGEEMAVTSGTETPTMIGCGGYIAFTSGTTGAPRPLVVAAASLVRHLDSVCQELGLDASTRYLAASPLGFDPVYEQLLAPLLVGGTVVLKAERPWHPDLLVERLRTLRVTDANLPTAMFTEWVRSGCELRLPEHVLGVLPGGAALSRNEAAAFLEANPGVILRNAYGPTETVVTASMSPIGATDLEPGAAPSIGKPLPGRTLQPRTAALEPARQLSAAELIVGGVTAIGYWGDPRATALKFIPDPASAIGGRCYRTGDLVRVRDASRLEFIGRRDRQLNVLGVRIESEEIEQFVASAPWATEAAIVESNPGTIHTETVLWVESGDSQLTVARVREHFSARYPIAALPGTITIEADLPRTDGGKIDHARLRTRQQRTAAHPQAPSISTPLRGMPEVLDKFRTVLGQPCVPESDFFALGGNSLSGLRLARLMGDVLGRTVTLADIFAAPTPAGLLARIADTTAAATPAPPPRPVRVGTQVPLLPEQIAFLLEGELGDKLAPVVIVPIDLTEELAAEQLADALVTVIARHEGLRLRIFGTEASVADVDPISVRDALHPVAADSPEAGRALVRDWASHFDVARSSFEARVLQVGTHRTLTLMVHHSVFDERSLELVLADLGRALTGDISVREPAVQFSDAARRRSALPAAPLDDTTYDELPLPGGASADGGVIQVTVPLAPYRLNDLAREHATTPLTVAAAFWHAALREWSGVERIRLGVPIDTRTADERVVGSFVSVRTLAGPGRTVDPDRSVRWFHEAMTTAITQAQTTAAPARRIPNAMVATVTAAQTLIPSGAPMRYRDVVPFAIPSRLLLVEERSASDSRLLIRGDATAVTRDHLEQIADIMSGMLRGRASDARTSVQSSDTPASPRPGTPPDVRPAPLSAMQRLDIECLRRPDGTALYDGSRALSRAEFLRKVRRAAAVLKDNGVHDGGRVAVQLPMSADLVIAANAAMWLGAAYVPIDPALPADRRARVLADVDPTLLVTDGPTADAVGVPLLDVRDLAGTTLEAASPVPASPQRVAHIVYTSGSTGIPKGVCISESALATFLDWNLGRVLGTDTLVAISSPGFDLSVIDTVWPCTGGAVAVLGPHDRFDPALIALQLRETLSRTTGTVGIGASLSVINAVYRQDPTLFAGLSVMLGGEPVPPRLIDNLAARGARVVIGYGPTETTVLATATDPLRNAPEYIALGGALGSVDLDVVGPDLQPIRSGHIGTLHIGGPTVGLGYFRNPRATALRFIPAPAGSRRYRTGDLVRERRGGLEYLGREDRQVKVNGVRVELGEIEQLLRRADGVSDARVVPAEQTAGLIAFIVTAPEIPAAAISAELRRSLPVGVSARVISCTGLPLSPNGKIDDTALLATIPAADPHVQHELSDLERLLIVTAGRVLGIDGDTITPDDDLFALGGTSLSVIELSESVHELFDVRLPLRELYEDLTLAGVVSCLRHHVPDAAERAAEFIPYLRTLDA